MEELIRLRLDELNRLKQDLLRKQKKDIQKIEVRMQELIRLLGDKDVSFGHEDEITPEMNLPFEFDEDESYPVVPEEEALVETSPVNEFETEENVDQIGGGQIADEPMTEAPELPIGEDEHVSEECCNPFEDSEVTVGAIAEETAPDVPELPIDEEEPIVEVASASVAVDPEPAVMMGETDPDMPELPGDEEEPIVEAASTPLVVDSELAAMVGETDSGMPGLPGDEEEAVVEAVSTPLAVDTELAAMMGETEPVAKVSEPVQQPRVKADRVVLPPDLELAITENESLLEDGEDSVAPPPSAVGQTPINAPATSTVKTSAPAGSGSSQSSAKASEEDIDALVRGMFS